MSFGMSRLGSAVKSRVSAGDFSFRSKGISPNKKSSSGVSLSSEKACRKEAVSKVETPRHSRKSGNLLPIVNN
jgi:hypothetical protein